MKPLIVVTLHDREEHVGPCLSSLRGRAGADFTLAVVANGCDFDPAPYLVGDHNIDVMQPLGPARARNASLRFRSPGQDWMFVDSDIVFQTEGWLAKMLATLHQSNIGVVTPAIANADGTRPFGGIHPNTGKHTLPHAPVGARLCRGDLVDAIGAQRSYGLYGCEDLDYDERTRAAGYRIVWDSDVVVTHPGTPSDDDWKRAKLEECIPCFKEWERFYRAGQLLFEPSGSVDTPRPPRASP